MVLRANIGKHDRHNNHKKIWAQRAPLSNSGTLLKHIRFKLIMFDLEGRASVKGLQNTNHFSRNIDPGQCFKHTLMINLIESFLPIQKPKNCVVARLFSSILDTPSYVRRLLRRSSWSKSILGRGQMWVDRYGKPGLQNGCNNLARASK